MVAVGNLDKIWSTIPADVTEEELHNAFRSYFGAEWTQVLDVTDNSLAYNATNSAYFAIRNLRPVENLTLEQLLEKKGVDQLPNIIIS